MKQKHYYLIDRLVVNNLNELLQKLFNRLTDPSPNDYIKGVHGPFVSPSEVSDYEEFLSSERGTDQEKLESKLSKMEVVCVSWSASLEDQG